MQQKKGAKTSKSSKVSQLLSSSEGSGTDLNAELNAASGKLLESTASMHTFAQALNASGFREYVDYMGRPWRSFWFNFLIGIARGLGFVIGATVIVALVVWVISQILAQLPFVGEFFETLGTFLSEENLKNLQSGNVMDSLGTIFETFRTSVLDTYQSVPPQ